MASEKFISDGPTEERIGTIGELVCARSHILDLKGLNNLRRGIEIENPALNVSGRYGQVQRCIWRKEPRPHTQNTIGKPEFGIADAMCHSGHGASTNDR